MSIDRINSIFNRIEQIEQKISQNPDAPVQSQSFQQTFSQVQGQMNPGRIDNLQAMQPGMMQPGMPVVPGMPMAPGMPVNPMMNYQNMPYPGGAGAGASVKPLAQNNSVSCGQTSVAMCVNNITGQNLTDADINAKYGFNLLQGLNAECSKSGVQWKDGGNISPYSWNLIDQKVNAEKTPVIVALNGPEFSPSGRGHIVTIVKTEGNTVYFADPANGQIRTTTKEAMENAPKHPDGNFIFFAERANPMMNQFAFNS